MVHPEYELFIVHRPGDRRVFKRYLKKTASEVELLGTLWMASLFERVERVEGAAVRGNSEAIGTTVRVGDFRLERTIETFVHAHVRRKRSADPVHLDLLWK